MLGDAHDTTPPPLPSVFISYASADRAAARALRDTLTAAGLEVWLDEDELGGGEAWDTKIRNQIRTCTYFMPVISATTEVRREGYFRREWRLAVERTLDFADDVMFLVPVVIDATRDAGARVPEKFFTVQWLRVPDGQPTPALQDLAQKLAKGEAVAHPPAAPIEPAASPRKSRRTAAVPEVSRVPRAGPPSAFLLRPRAVVRPPAPLPLGPPPPLRAGHRRDRDYFQPDQLDLPREPPGSRDQKGQIGNRIRSEQCLVLGRRPAPAEHGHGGRGDRIRRRRGRGGPAVRPPRCPCCFQRGRRQGRGVCIGCLRRGLLAAPEGRQAAVGAEPAAAQSGCYRRRRGRTRSPDEKPLVLTGHVGTPIPGLAGAFTARLFDVGTGQMVWKETFESAANESATVAQRIATEITKRLEPPAPPPPPAT